jgi:hypothetical protein
MSRNPITSKSWVNHYQRHLLLKRIEYMAKR